MKKVWLIQFTCIGFLLGVTNINKGISTFKRRADGSRENIAHPETKRLNFII
jgi:F0F1-type ATP synthase assembly protein I